MIMKIGFIGLGRMGNPMVVRLLKNNHQVVVYNRTPEKVREMMKKGALGAATYLELVSKLGSPKIIWLMVPHAAVDEVIANLRPHLHAGDILIDGGNSNFHDSKRRSEDLEGHHIQFLDVGVSGGTAAAKTGYCMMAGGNHQTFQKVTPLLKSMCVKDGFTYMGPTGAGHFVKMVHNAIEYGIMEAMGEGYDLLKHGPYHELDLLSISKVWNNGSIIRGFLMDMNINALTHHKDLKNVPGIVADNGEGKWAVEEAMRK